MKAIFDYEKTYELGADMVGGKAWNMARLSRWGFCVPRGIVVATTLYEEVLQRPKISKLVVAAQEITANNIAEPASAALLERLRAQIIQATFSNAQLEELSNEMDTAELTNAPLAVRSSATGEDGAEHSFAGIHESYLNIQGTTETANSIVKCFASLWTPQALAYRRRFNLDDKTVKAGVLICAMVAAPQSSEPVAAGVIFTAEPTTGRRDIMIIEATSGLGDKLVNGSITPTMIRVQMGVADFNYQISGTTPLPRDQIDRLILTAERILWAFSDGEVPQDIEWAYDGEKIVILQVRPVTSIKRRTYPALSDQPEIWTNANFKEVLSGIMSPMGWSLMPRYSANHFFDVHHISKYCEPKGMQIVRRFAGRAYVDASIIQYSAFDAWGILPRETNRSFGGFQPEISLGEAKPYKGRQGLKRLTALTRVMRAAWRGRKVLHSELVEIETRAIKYSRQNLATQSMTQLTNFWRSMSEQQWQPPYMIASATGSMWLGIARQIGSKHLEHQELEELIGGLMSGQGGVVSAEHAYALHDIIQTHDVTGSAFETALDKWLDKYGHRGFNEFDIANPRWQETRNEIVKFAQNLARAHHSPYSAAKTRKASEAKLHQLPLFLRQQLGWVVRKASDGFRLREQGKSALIAVIGTTRHIVLEFGKRMHDAGIIDHADDVFMLAFADIWAWANDAWDGTNARHLIADRVAQMNEWSSAPAPADVILINANNIEELDPVSRVDGSVIRGHGVSPGVANGVACKVDDPAKPETMQEGCILVARSTDPSWTPLFLSASGIVVEIGGYLSHGAIVAREFGLPAVVNAPGCFDAIEQGAMLHVDGNTGLIDMQ